MVGSAIMSRPEDRPDTGDAPPNPAGKRFCLGLGGITLLALAWRVFYVIHEQGRILLNGDAFYYHWQVDPHRAGQGFHRPGAVRCCSAGVTPSAGHPPAYILYLAAVSKFIGTSELTQRLASTLLGAGAVFMLGVLARRSVRERLGGLDRGTARGRLRAPLDQRRDAHVGEHVRAHDRVRGVDRVPVLGPPARAHRGAHGARHRARRAEPGRSHHRCSRSSRSRSRSS